MTAIEARHRVARDADAARSHRGRRWSATPRTTKAAAPSFRILLFSDEFRWRINSFDALEQGGKRPQFTAEMKAVLNNAREIICVGASSEEIPPGMSSSRAARRKSAAPARRAEKIAVWVREALNARFRSAS